MIKSTVSTKTFGGVPVLVPNIVTNQQHHYISYNNYDTYSYGCDTTAIVATGWYNGKPYGQVFLILNGNHYDQLNSLDLIGCLEYFSKIFT